MNDDGLRRRQFIQYATATAAVAALGLSGCKSGFSRTLTAKPRKPAKHKLEKGVYVARGENAYKMTVEAVRACGGMRSLVKKDAVVVVKPNMAWDRTPQLAANTNPDVVRAVVDLCLKAGAAAVYVFDRPCNDAKRSYSRSGIADAARAAGAKVPFISDSEYVTLSVPGATTLTSTSVNRRVLEADVFINVPIVKHHSAAGMTAGLKNMMGLIGGDRGKWHVGGLGARIAEINSAIPADLTIVDAYRILTAHGPVGGSLDDVKQTGLIAATTDRVAADAWAAGVFGVEPEDVEAVKIAAEMGQGEINLEKIGVSEFDV